MATKSQWADARLKYETRPNCSQTDLAHDLGCTRQAVSKRVTKEGWLKADVVVKDLAITEPVAGSKLGIRSEENISELVNVYALTGNKAMACRRVGIDDKTLHNWVNEEPELSITMTAMREAHLIGQYRKIADSRDWKAAKEILARSPETKDQWGEVHDSGPQIILNIHRDEVVIEG